MKNTLTLATLLATLVLTACGGGTDDPAPDAGGTGGTGGGGGGGSAALTCNTAAYVAGAVAAPTSAELAAYVGSFAGEEGSYAMDGSFTKSGNATLVFSGEVNLSYKGVSYPVSSMCLDKVAGPYGRILYVIAGTGTGAGHFDIASASAGPDLGQAWGVSPADGMTVFRNGLKP